MKPAIENTNLDENRGLIFHIIRGSFVDGHGVRTTVFLKGCPLKCKWCCNPEGQRDYPEIKLTVSECNACGRCVDVCPPLAIQLHSQTSLLPSPSPSMVEGLRVRVKPASEGVPRILKINRDLCTRCGKCVEVCYTGALEFFGKYVTVDELFANIEKDEQYYRSSGGGVTIGGGEPTFQPAFTRALLKKCKDACIHTALDTCGYTTSEEGVKALAEADLLLYDIKGWNPKEHLKNTGVPIAPILENIKKSGAMRKPIIIRMPLIPGLNDSPQNIQSIAQFLAGLKSLERVDLLAYHEYGRVKYAQLGRKYGAKTHPLTEERLNEIKLILERHGLHVQIGG